MLTVKVVPASSRTSLAGLLNGMLKIKVAAAPQKGKANRALIEFIAKKLGVKKNAVRIIAGETNQVKNVEVAGITAEQALEKLSLV